MVESSIVCWLTTFALMSAVARLRVANVLLFLGLGTGEPRFSRRDLGLLGLGLAGKAIDHCFLRFDAGLGGVNRQLVVTVIKLEDDIAGLDQRHFPPPEFP